MPQYTYKCHDCACVFDDFNSMAKSGEEKICPQCGAQSRRHYTRAPGFIMRPRGWNLRPGDEGYDSDFELDKPMTQARWR